MSVWSEPNLWTDSRVSTLPKNKKHFVVLFRHKIVQVFLTPPPPPCDGIWGASRSPLASSPSALLLRSENPHCRKMFSFKLMCFNGIFTFKHLCIAFSHLFENDQVNLSLSLYLSHHYLACCDTMWTHPSKGTSDLKQNGTQHFLT